MADEKNVTSEEEVQAAGEELHEKKTFLTNRRMFLGGLAGLVGLAGASQVVVPLLGTLTPVQRGKPQPVEISLEDLPDGGKPYDGRYGSKQFKVFNRGGKFEAISLVCTHLGCLVKWYPEANGGKGQFKCPCHDGGFDEHGVNAFGPPPAPLELLPYKVVGDKLIVGGE